MKIQEETAIPASTKLRFRLDGRSIGSTVGKINLVLQKSEDAAMEVSTSMERMLTCAMVRARVALNADLTTSAQSLSDSVRRLRAELGDSQQSLAVKLGLSVRSIANYETGSRCARPCVLAGLSRLARANGLPELAEVFEAAFKRATEDRTTAATPEERGYVTAILRLSRNRHLVPDLWATIESALSDAAAIAPKKV